MMETKNKLLYIDSDDSSNQEQNTSGQVGRDKGKQFNMVGSAKMGQNMMAKNFLKQQENDGEYFHEQKPEGSQNADCVVMRTSRKKPTAVEKVTLSRHGIESEPHQSSETNSSTQKKVEEEDQRIVEHTPKQRPNKEKILTFDLAESDDQISSSQQEAQNSEQEKGEQIKSSQLFQQNNSDQEDQRDEIRPTGQKVATSKKQITVEDLAKKLDKYDFAESIIPKGYILSTTLLKSKPASNFFYPKFDVFLNKTQVHILSGKKQMGNFGSNYPMGVDPENFTYLRDRNNLGKLRTVKQSHIFNIFSPGSNPQNMRGNFQGKKRRSVLVTVQQALVKGPRSMQVYVLKEGQKYLDMLKFPHEQPTLKDLYSIQENKNKINYYRTKKPKWVQEMSQYFLNFDGRISLPSVRNFILEDPATEEEVLLFGKHDNNIYQMDVSHPMSPQVAMGIVLCMFDYEP